MTAQPASTVPDGYAAAAQSPIIVVTGPTATGKTHLAVCLARMFHGEILSVDSRQIYRGLDLGTGKDLAEYSEGGPAVPYHLIDVADPCERFDLYRFLELARVCLVDMHRRGVTPILCGGTPLYLLALLNGYAMEGGEPDRNLRAKLEDCSTAELISILRASAPPELVARTDLTQDRRIIRAIEIARSLTDRPAPPPLSNTLVLAPQFTRAEVRERIAIRLDARLGAGLIDEVRALHDQKGMTWERLDWLGLEYRFIARHLQGMLTSQEMHDTLLAHIRQFAKRQDGWFRKFEREGHHIHWIPAGDPEMAIPLVQNYLTNAISI
ncbi:MAG: tRNA (adenosine(37)-N6)-dimethylallyltransferase MiaA [Victivallales bacterium]|nr:tRNA (adenosine(37)-N6)-dimethylallyltransferase MiaA [Victivallales bacterium]